MENKCIESPESNEGSFVELSSLLKEIEIDKNASIKSSGEEKISPRVVQDTTKSNHLPIPPEVKFKLEEWGIPLDEGVRKIIKDHDISQVWGAIRHIEETWETINNPRGVFLYQVPRQEKEKSLKNPLIPEFLEWYSQAIIEGLVQARPAEHLPLDQFREPKVFLRDGHLMAWRKVAAGEGNTLASPEQMVEFFQKLRGYYEAAKK
jgi:hypothetical protein